jgi:hypothetical protein
MSDHKMSCSVDPCTCGAEPDADRYELKLYRAGPVGLICYRTISGDKAEVLAALHEGGSA